MATKILIVDDDPDTIEFLRIILERQGYSVLIAHNGLEALKMAHREKPDLVVLDIMMPGLDGYEVARTLRRHPETALTPIMMFTAKSQTQDKVAGYEAGVDIYLTKPVHPLELQVNIKTLISQKTARTETLAKRGYVIGVMGAKGGLGVSTMTLNLAISYAKKKNGKVIAAEMRPGQGTWGEELGLTAGRGIANLLRMNVSEITSALVEQELTNTTYGIRTLLATANSADVDTSLAAANYEAIIQHMAQVSGLVVLDIGTSFLPAYPVILNQCDEILVVTEPQPITAKRTRILIEDLRKMNFGSSKAMTVVTVNRTRADLTLSLSQLENVLGQSIAMGFPPATEAAFQAATRNLPLCLIQPEGIVAQQFGLLADQIGHRVQI